MVAGDWGGDFCCGHGVLSPEKSASVFWGVLATVHDLRRNRPVTLKCLHSVQCATELAANKLPTVV